MRSAAPQRAAGGREAYPTDPPTDPATRAQGRCTMAELTITDAGPGFANIVEGFQPTMFGDDAVTSELQELFDTRGVVVIRGVELTYAEQTEMCELLIRKPDSTPSDVPSEDTWYVSNERPNATAPYGRLQFHMDTAWAHEPNEIVSLYASELEAPVAPTSFAGMVTGYAALPDELKARLAGLEAINSAGQIRRRGDLSDVLLSPVERPPWTRKPVVLTHPRTGERLVYVCEQNTREIVGMDPVEGEALLDEVFDHVYAASNVWDHEWQLHDLACWDNLAIQHARPNVPLDGPVRTLRKVATPMPALEQDEMPVYSTAR
jgi:alpha-ketoglutarate-dependent taurine dioxygenase